MRLYLIPECDRRDVIGQGQIPAATSPSQGLDGHAQIRGKANRVGDVPTVKAKSLLGLVKSVRLENLH